MTRPLERFWETVPLAEMSAPQWESLCDGCGKCCLNKLEDEDTGYVLTTRLACVLFDDASCRCQNYPQRQSIVPDCLRLTIENLPLNKYWLPETCAYRLLFEGKPLPDWHPLLTGDPASVHRAGMSVQGRTLSETDVPYETWQEYPLED